MMREEFGFTCKCGTRVYLSHGDPQVYENASREPHLCHMNEPMPNPGSPSARALGCSCSVALNKLGKGAGAKQDGTPLFVTSGFCPLHGRGSAWASNKETT